MLTNYLKCLVLKVPLWPHLCLLVLEVYAEQQASLDMFVLNQTGCVAAN